VARLQILLDFVHQVAAVDPALALVPEVMMGVANREIGLKNVFLDLSQPSVVRRH
jgi:hypothetical protein